LEIHKEKSNKMQQSINIFLFHIYMKLNVLRATHGTETFHTVPENVHQLHGQQPSTYEEPEAGSAVLDS
jgi:hypothetical protein